MIITCAIVIMITVITVVLMTMPRISVLMITKAWGLRSYPQGRWGGKETMAQFGLALGSLQLISTPLFILVIVLCPTKT